MTDHKLEMIDAGGDDKVVFGTAKWSAQAVFLQWFSDACLRTPSRRIAQIETTNIQLKRSKLNRSGEAAALPDTQNGYLSPVQAMSGLGPKAAVDVKLDRGPVCP